MGSLKKALLFVPPDDGGALLVYVLPFYMANIMALVVVGWIRESYDDDVTPER